MTFVIYHKLSTKLLKVEYYPTERAAKIARTNAAKRGEIVADDYLIAETAVYYNNIERMVWRENLLTGERYQESINTSPSCSPAYETYWSM